MPSNQLFSNNAASEIATQLLIAGTTLNVTATEGALFNAPTGTEYELLTLIRASDSAIEIVKVTARTADALTIVRAQEGTTALQFEIGDTVEARVTAGSIKNAADGFWEADAEDIRITKGTSNANFNFANIELGNINVCSGAYSSVISVGRNTEILGDAGVVLGGTAKAGNHATALGNFTQALGIEDIAIGASSVADGNNAVSIGINHTGFGGRASKAVAIGFKASASAVGSYALGEWSRSPVTGAINIAAIPMIGSSLSNGEWASDATRILAGSGTVITTPMVDMSVAATTTLTLPSGAIFFPMEIGVMFVTESSSVGNPDISIGITGNNTKYLGISTITAPTIRMEQFTPVSTDGESTGFTFTVDTAITSGTLKARFFIRGIFMDI